MATLLHGAGLRLMECLQRHLQAVRTLHEQDIREGAGHVSLPYALERKYPHANHEDLRGLYAVCQS